ncbi:phosphopantetheine-binding protein [Micromonosporaceae bacterium Da 78-11]
MNRTEIVERVRRAWQQALDVDDVPLELPFFEAGGDSLLLIILLEELNTLADGRLEAADLFQHSTVLAQVALISGDVGLVPATEVGPRNRAALLNRARPGYEEVR